MKLKKVKFWLKKNKTNIALGVVTVAGVCMTRYAYGLGYDNGHFDGFDKGFKEGTSFYTGDVEVTKASTF